MGGGIEEAGAWRPYPLLDAGEGGSVATRPCSDPGRGNREGRRGRGLGRRLASWARWAGLACELGRLVQWGGYISFLYFSFLFYFTLKYLGTF